LAEVGRYCDSANDPVTTEFAGELLHLHDDPLAEARSRRNHARRGVILKRLKPVSEKIMPQMTGGVAWI
jgi:hypothetical protein